MMPGEARKLQSLITFARRQFSVNSGLNNMNGINSKHFKTGDPCPPLDANKVSVINMRFCPFAQRTLLILIKKGIRLAKTCFYNSKSKMFRLLFQQF